MEAAALISLVDAKETPKIPYTRRWTRVKSGVSTSAGLCSSVIHFPNR